MSINPLSSCIFSHPQPSTAENSAPEYDTFTDSFQLESEKDQTDPLQEIDLFQFPFDEDSEDPFLTDEKFFQSIFEEDTNRPSSSELQLQEQLATKNPKEPKPENAQSHRHQWTQDEIRDLKLLCIRHDYNKLPIMLEMKKKYPCLSFPQIWLNANDRKKLDLKSPHKWTTAEITDIQALCTQHKYQHQPIIFEMKKKYASLKPQQIIRKITTLKKKFFSESHVEASSQQKTPQEPKNRTFYHQWIKEETDKLKELSLKYSFDISEITLEMQVLYPELSYNQISKKIARLRTKHFATLNSSPKTSTEDHPSPITFSPDQEQKTTQRSNRSKNPNHIWTKDEKKDLNELCKQYNCRPSPIIQEMTKKYNLSKLQINHGIATFKKTNRPAPF